MLKLKVINRLEKMKQCLIVYTNANNHLEKLERIGKKILGLKSKNADTLLVLFSV